MWRSSLFLSECVLFFPISIHVISTTSFRSCNVNTSVSFEISLYITTTTNSKKRVTANDERGNNKFLLQCWLGATCDEFMYFVFPLETLSSLVWLLCWLWAITKTKPEQHKIQIKVFANHVQNRDRSVSFTHGCAQSPAFFVPFLYSFFNDIIRTKNGLSAFPNCCEYCRTFSIVSFFFFCCCHAQCILRVVLLI